MKNGEYGVYNRNGNIIESGMCSDDVCTTTVDNISTPTPRMIVVTNSKDGYVNIRTEPTSRSAIGSRVGNNIQFDVLDTIGDWYNVSVLGSGVSTGFIHKSQVYVK